jgi:hypothetical protein
MLHPFRFSLQNAVYFIILPFLVNVLFNFTYRVCQNLNIKFKVCKSVHHRTIQINHQADATIFQFIILTFVYTSVSPPIIRSSKTAVAASGFTFVLWWQSCCVRDRAGRILIKASYMRNTTVRLLSFETVLTQHIAFPISGTRLCNDFNPLNAELNPIYHLLALLGAHLILHVSRIRVNHTF